MDPAGEKQALQSFQVASRDGIIDNVSWTIWKLSIHAITIMFCYLSFLWEVRATILWLKTWKTENIKFYHDLFGMIADDIKVLRQVTNHNVGIL